jgi:ribonuclease HI
MLLDKTNKEMHQSIMMLLWRCWHLRNDIIHDKGKATIKHSVHFLLNYAISLHANLCTTSKNMPLDSKGKKPMWNHLPDTCKETKKNKTDLQKWKPPDQGWLKVNVDGSYIAETGQASIGVVIRDHTGQAVLAAGKNFQNCCDAQESEALAAKEGARLAAQWCNKPVIFESDCTTITHAIQSKEQHLSQLKSILHDFNLYASNQWRTQERIGGGAHLKFFFLRTPKL